MVDRLGWLLSTSTPASKESLLRTLKGLLIECMTLRRVGGGHSRLAYSQGYADGVMRCLLDAKMVTQNELLTFVAEVRRGLDGPSVRTVEPDELELSAASSSAMSG